MKRLTKEQLESRREAIDLAKLGRMIIDVEDRKATVEENTGVSILFKYPTEYIEFTIKNDGTLMLFHIPPEDYK